MSHPDGNATALAGHAAMQLLVEQEGHGSKPDASPGSSRAQSTRSAARKAIHGPNLGCTITPTMLGPASPAAFPSCMKLRVARPFMNGNTIEHRAPDFRTAGAISDSTVARVKSSRG